jgi:hypothetical protein
VVGRVLELRLRLKIQRVILQDVFITGREKISVIFKKLPKLDEFGDLG